MEYAVEQDGGEIAARDGFAESIRLTGKAISYKVLYGLEAIDTEIRHVTKAGANLYVELGFSAAEAKQLHAASRKQINDTRALKQQLMSELSN